MCLEGTTPRLPPAPAAPWSPFEHSPNCTLEVAEDAVGTDVARLVQNLPFGLPLFGSAEEVEDLTVFGSELGQSASSVRRSSPAGHSLGRSSREEYSAVRYESPPGSPPSPCAPLPSAPLPSAVAPSLRFAFDHVNLPRSPIRDVWATTRDSGYDPSPSRESPRLSADENVEHERTTPVLSSPPAGVTSSSSSPDLGVAPGSTRLHPLVMRSSSAKELARPYSPPVLLVGDLLEHERTTFGSRHFRPHAEPQEHSEIEVIFDPGIGCYYDPKTNKYYRASTDPSSWPTPLPAQ